jgi:hypothetical protein
VSRLLIERIKCDVCRTSYVPDVQSNWRNINGHDVCYRCAVVVARASRLELIDAIIADMPPTDTYAELEVLET